MKKIFIGIVLLFFACGGGGGTPSNTSIDPQVSDDGLRAYGACRHEALIAAVIYEEAGYETRIPYGPMDIDHDIYHVQAQAKINGQWEWLSTRTIVVYVDDQDDFKVIRDYTADDLFDFSMSGEWGF